MKWFVYFIFIILYLLVTFFGLGPVLMADGSHQERVMTFIVVLVIYVLLTGILYFWRKRQKNKRL